MTLQELAQASGLSYNHLRDATRRAPTYNPLRHIKSGSKYLVEIEDYTEWKEKEKDLCTGIK